MAAAAETHYTLELVEPLKESSLPVLLVWREEDEFQPVGYARRFEKEVPTARLETVPGARHVPMEDAPEQVGTALAGFFANR